MQISSSTMAALVDSAEKKCSEVVGEYVKLFRELESAKKGELAKAKGKFAKTLEAIYKETKDINDKLAVLVGFQNALRDVVDEPLPEELAADVSESPIDPYATDEGFARTVAVLMKDKNSVSRLYTYAALLRCFNGEIASRTDRIEKLKDRIRKEPGSNEGRAAKILKTKNEKAVEVLGRRRDRVGQQFLRLRCYLLKKILNVSTKVSDMFPDGGMRAFEVKRQARNPKDDTLIYDPKSGEAVMVSTPELTDISLTLRLLWDEITSQRMTRKITGNWMDSGESQRRKR